MTKAELGVEAGQVVAGKYRLQRLLGRGGMGSVWACDDLELLSPVALKIIKPDVAQNRNSVARFMREAKAAALLRSPYVVQIFEHGTDGSIVYIAMEMLDGESLLGRLKRLKRLKPAVVATIMRQVGKAMQKAHDAGIIHRDLKPDNIFVMEDDDEIIAKVLDFGIAKSALFALNPTGESPQTQTGALLGTPYYMSPEQATGQKSVDHRADLWALGVITYECLIGKRPYQSDSLGDLVLQICSRAQPVPSHHGSVPAGFDEWFSATQQRDPERRFQSARDMTRTLHDILLQRPGGVARGAAKTLPQPTPAVTTQPPINPTSSTGDAASWMPEAPPPHPIAHHPGGPVPITTGGAHTPAPATAPVGTPSHAAASASANTVPFYANQTDPRAPAAHVAAAEHPSTSATIDDPLMSLETLDPLAATVTRRGRTLLGVSIAAILVGAGGVLGISLLMSDGSSTDTDTSPSAPSEAAVVAESAEVAASAAADTTSASTSSASTSASTSASVAKPVVQPPRRSNRKSTTTTAPPPKTQPPPAPAPVPKAQPQPLPKPRPKVDDPLGI